MKPSTIKYSTIILIVAMLTTLCFAVQDLSLTGIAICTGMTCVGLVMCIDILVPRGELHDAAASSIQWHTEQAIAIAHLQDIFIEHDSAHLAVDFSWMDGMTVDEADEVFKDIIGH